MHSGGLKAQALGYNNHRIAMSADGNNQSDNHPEANYPRADPDDWGGTPAALVMIAKKSLQGKLVHFSYNNFIGAPPHTNERNVMKEGVDGAIQRFGFDASRIFDVSANETAAVNHLANEIGKSTATDPLYFIHMGPSEFLYRAVQKTIDNGKINALSYVWIVSHSGYNENHLRRNSHHTLSQVRALSGQRLEYKKIGDQNACQVPAEKWCSLKNFSPWHWIRDHVDPNVQWLYSRMLQNRKGHADISDAGMVFYLLTGDEKGSPSKFKNFIGNGIPTSGGGGTPFVSMRKNGGAYAIDGDNGGANHQNVYQWTYNPDTPNQQWEEISKGNGYYAYKKRNTNFCLDGGRGGANGQNVILYNCGSNNQNQQWKKISVGGGKYRLEKRNAPGYSIDGGNGGANGQNLYLWASSNSNVNQQWLFSSNIENVEAPIDDNTPLTTCINEEVDGLLLFQAENTTLKGGWKLGLDPNNASGGQFIYFDAPNQYGSVNNVHTISYQFKINNAGKYHFKWTMRQPDGEIGSDLGNDAWFYFPGDIATGRGTPLTRFRKFVGRSTEAFTWNGNVELGHNNQPWVVVNFATPGVYTLNISGRSHGLRLDRLALYKIGTYNDQQAKQKAGEIAVTGDCDGGGGDTPIVTMRKNAGAYAIDGDNGGANHQNVYQWSFNPATPNQQWEEINKGNGYYAYKKRNTNFCLDGGAGGAKGQNVFLYTCGANNQNQQWKKVSVGGGKYRLEKRNAPGFSIDGGNGGANGQNLYLWTSSNTNVNQQWLFSAVSSARVNLPDGIKTVAQALVYPNPFSDGEMTINLSQFNSPTSIKIFDAKGVLVYETQSEPGLLKINAGNFNGKGLYVVSITENGQAPIMAKFIVK